MRLSEFPCSLCGGTNTVGRYPDTRQGSERDVSAFRCTHAGYGRHFKIVQCRNCAFVFSTPRPIKEDIAQLYSDVEDPVYVNELDGRALTFANRAKSVASYRTPPGRLLDVGAYAGSFVAAARNAGFEAEGLEPSKWATEEARRSGIPVRQGSLAPGIFPSATFDVVTLWDVIEHLSDPLTDLRQSASLLKSGGLIVVHTMDVDSVFARLMGSRWPWFMEMHLHYFSRHTLRSMLDKAGFDVVQIVAEGRSVSTGYLVSRLEGLLGRRLASPLAWAVRTLGLERVQLGINLGDLVTAYAVKR